MLFYSVQKCLILGKIGKMWPGKSKGSERRNHWKIVSREMHFVGVPTGIYSTLLAEMGLQRRNRGIRERVKKVSTVAGMEFFIVYMSGEVPKKRVVFPLCSCGHYFHIFDAHHRCVFMPLYITNCTGSTLWPLA